MSIIPTSTSTADYVNMTVAINSTSGHLSTYTAAAAAVVVCVNVCSQCQPLYQFVVAVFQLGIGAIGFAGMLRKYLMQTLIWLRLHLLDSLYSKAAKSATSDELTTNRICAVQA
jgi:hypothetical protein